MTHKDRKAQWTKKADGSNHYTLSSTTLTLWRDVGRWKCSWLMPSTEYHEERLVAESLEGAQREAELAYIDSLDEIIDECLCIRRHLTGAENNEGATNCMHQTIDRHPRK